MATVAACRVCYATGIDNDELNAHVKTRMQVEQPVRKSGFGLRPYQKISPVAYYAAQASTANLMQSIAPCTTHDPTPTEIELTRVHNELVDLGVKHETVDKVQGQIFPVNDTREEREAFYAKKQITCLQHALQIQVDNKVDRDLKKVCDRGDLARLRALVQKGARRTMSKQSFIPKFALLNNEFSLMVRMRLGLRPCAPAEMPHVCACGQLMDELPNNHMMTCQQAAGAGWITCHNGICHALGTTARDAACVVRAEVKYPGIDVRPDLVITDPTGKTIIVDVSAVQSDAASHASRPAGGAVAQRERDKASKYRTLIERTKAEFVPVVVDRFGGYGIQAQDLFTKLSVFADRFSMQCMAVDDAAPLYIIWAAMMKALYQGNVALVRQAVIKCETVRLSRLFFAPHHHDAADFVGAAGEVMDAV